MASAAGEPNPLEMFASVTGRVGEMVAAVRQSQAEDATPCAEWDVRALLNHLLGGLEFTAGGLAGDAPNIRVAEADSSYVDEPDVAVLARAYRTLAERVLQTAAEPGALARIVSTPYFGDMPVDRILMGTLMDHIIHGWDLATATGQDATIEPHLVEFTHGMLASGFAEMGRQAGFIGPAIDVPDDASPQDKLIAYMGRQP